MPQGDIGGSGGPQAVYLFALTEGVPADSAIIAADGPFPPPLIHRAGPIAAIVSLVAPAEYCAPAAAQRAADPAWLAPRAVQHAALLRQAMQRGPVYPVPFGTLFANLDRLSAFMLAHQETLCGFFRQVAGREEWTLTAGASLDSPAMLDRIARASDPGWAEMAPGARYLQLCRERTRLIALGRQRAGDHAAALAVRLQPPAVAIRRLAVHPNADAEPVGRFALLVPSDAVATLNRRVQELLGEAAEDGITLAFSGPWPAFSFRPDLPGPETQNEAQALR